MNENPITSELVHTDLHELIPESLISAAKNPENLELTPLREGDGKELNIIIVEHGYGGQTDDEKWTQWLLNIREAKSQFDDSDIFLLPAAPEGVDRLHARFRKDIESGRFSLSDRILLTCKLRIQEGEENMLYVGDYDGEIGLGIAIDFYTNTLPKLAKKIGVRFITGQNDAKNLSFFTDRIGRYTYAQLKPEAKNKLFPDIKPNSTMGDYTTIQFLDHKDVEKYILEEEIKP